MSSLFTVPADLHNVSNKHIFEVMIVEILPSQSMLQVLGDSRHGNSGRRIKGGETSGRCDFRDQDDVVDRGHHVPKCDLDTAPGPPPKHRYMR